jgi:hypothetical protein
MLPFELFPGDIVTLIFDYLSIRDLVNLFDVAMENGYTSVAQVANQSIMPLLCEMITTGQLYVEPAVDNGRLTYKENRNQVYRTRRSGSMLGAIPRPHRPFSSNMSAYERLTDTSPPNPYYMLNENQSSNTDDDNNPLAATLKELSKPKKPMFNRTFKYNEASNKMVVSVDMDEIPRSMRKGLEFRPESMDAGYGPTEIVTVRLTFVSDYIAGGGVLELLYDTDTLVIGDATFDDVKDIVDEGSTTPGYFRTEIPVATATRTISHVLALQEVRWHQMKLLPENEVPEVDLPEEIQLERVQPEENVLEEEDPGEEPEVQEPVEQQDDQPGHQPDDQPENHPDEQLDNQPDVRVELQTVVHAVVQPAAQPVDDEPESEPEDDAREETREFEDVLKLSNKFIENLLQLRARASITFEKKVLVSQRDRIMQADSRGMDWYDAGVCSFDMRFTLSKAWTTQDKIEKWKGLADAIQNRKIIAAMMAAIEAAENLKIMIQGDTTVPNYNG